jgi:hypothetical protein
LSQTVRWVVLTIGMLAALAAVSMLGEPAAAPPGERAPPPAHEPGPRVPVPHAAVRAELDAGAPPLAVDIAHAPESQLMREARAQLARDPERTLSLLRAADQRFGDEHEARRVLEIEALVKLERIGLSHARAERFYRSFPQSAEKGRIEQLTGYHPRPWGPSE